MAAGLTLRRHPCSLSLAVVLGQPTWQLQSLYTTGLTPMVTRSLVRPEGGGVSLRRIGEMSPARLTCCDDGPPAELERNQVLAALTCCR